MAKNILKLPVNPEVLYSRLDDVKKSLEKLIDLRNISEKEFFDKKTDDWALTAYYLQRALEGLLSCGSHILSRISGAKFDEYGTIASQLAEYGILPENFKEISIEMAKYRNRLVHFYHEIGKKELFNILQNNLKDLRSFYKYLLKFTKLHE